MFFEVCLLSLGVFASSELYKKIGSSYGEQSHNRNLQKKEGPQIHPLPAENNSQNNSTPENKELSSALESLTQEVFELRTDLSNYINANKKPSVQTGVVSPPMRQQAMRQQESVLPSSIFEKLIEENVSLRKGKTGE